MEWDRDEPTTTTSAPWHDRRADVANLTHKDTPVKTTDTPWYAAQYKVFGISSVFDDWHPDIYKNFDPDEWVELIASAGPDAVWIQAKSHSGNAYYKTELDHTHLGLRGRDAFGELMERFRQRGIKVVANQSILFDNYAYENHPDWRIRDAEGRDSKALGIGYGRPGVVCMNSPYRELALAQVDAFAKKYRPDGMLFDMVVIWIPVCYCQYCQRLYQEERDSELPGKDDRTSAAFHTYARWRNNKLRELTRDLLDAYKAHCPDGLTAFQGGRAYGGLPSLWDRMRMASITHGDPCQSDMSNLSVTFAASLFSNTTSNSPALLALGRFHLSEVQHTGLRSLDELMLSAAVCMAHNCGLMFIDVMNADGTFYASPYRAFKKVFDAMRPLEPFCGGEKVRCVGVYVSEDTKNHLYESEAKEVHVDWHSTSPLDAVETYTDGVQETFRAFLDHQIPVDVLTKLNLDELDKYALLVLPEAMCMSDEEVGRVRQYVEDGGNLVANRFTSLADADGVRKHNFALADVFGVDYLGETENNETYVKVRPELCESAGIPDDMEVKTDRQAIVKSRGNTEVLGHIVLPHTNRLNDSHRWVGWGSPPALVTDHPAIVMNSYGKGRCCYLSFRFHTLDSLFSVEEPRAMAYALGRSMLGDSVPLSAKNAPTWLLVTGHRRAETHDIVVHAVNAQQGTPVLPLQGIDVELRLRKGEKVVTVSSEPDKLQLAFEQHDGVVAFTMPEIPIHQVAVIGLA